LVGDRVGFLTVQAAAEGALDFRQANRFDRNWWRRFQLVVEYLDRQNMAKLTAEELQRDAMQMLSPMVYMDPVITKMVTDRVSNLEKRLESLRRPWITFQQRSPQDIIKAMSDRYKQEFMDYTSPEFDAEVSRLEAYWASGKDTFDGQGYGPFTERHGS
jgi:hypothetical protein